MSGRRRLDLELVRRGLAVDRNAARHLIEAGRVTVGGAPAANPSRQVEGGEPVAVAPPPARFVSRGGLKLDAALEHFGVVVAGVRALDAGSSTGGFTDCLLQRGAAEVVAVDVGYGQLHESLRQDPRVDLHERTNVRALADDVSWGSFTVLVADLSFISLATVAPALSSVAGPAADFVLLVKPQFEADRSEASNGRGIITDPAIWQRTVAQVCRAFEQRGARTIGSMVSPIHGAEGNTEFLVHLRAPGSS